MGDFIGEEESKETVCRKEGNFLDGFSVWSILPLTLRHEYRFGSD